MRIFGNYLYAIAQHEGIIVLDISDVQNITEVAQLEYPATTGGDYTRRMAVQGDYIYYGLKSGGINVIDASDPANPVKVGSLELPGNLEGLSISGNYLYVASPAENNPPEAGGLRIIDVSDPSNPTQVGVYIHPTDPDQTSYFSVYATGNFVYLALTGSGVSEKLITLDVSDPANPVQVGSAPYTGLLTSDGTNLYAIGDTNGVGNIIRSLDISDPTNVIQLDSLILTGQYAWSVYYENSRIYLAGPGGFGTQIIEVADPYNLALRGKYTADPDDPGVRGITGFHWGAVAKGDTVFTDTEKGLKILDV